MKSFYTSFKFWYKNLNYKMPDIFCVYKYLATFSSSINYYFWILVLSYLHSWSWFKTVCLRICKDIYYIMDLYYDNYLFVSDNIIWGPFNTLPSKVGSGQKKGLIQKIMKCTNFIGTNIKGISSIKMNFIYLN